MKLRTIQKASIKKGTRVIVRADFDSKLTTRSIARDYRVRQNLQTLRWVLRHGGLIRIVTHVGRPHGRVVPSLSTKPLVNYLRHTLKRNVVFIADPFRSGLWQQYNQSRDVLLFENIRFWPEDEKNDRHFAKKLAAWGDVFINEAFANAHRNHASVVALARLLPACAGFNFQKEITYLSLLLKKPRRPFVAALGGAKLETKLPLVEQFLKKADCVLAGGAIANTILSKQGKLKGRLLLRDRTPVPRNLTTPRLCLPIDVAATKNSKGKGGFVYKSIDTVQKNEYSVDLGPKTTRLFLHLIGDAKTVVWNGPFGCTEIPAFSRATLVFARALSRKNALTVVGGGDTVALLQKYNLMRGFTHVSTGGGAMLEFLSGKKLPGVEVLKR